MFDVHIFDIFSLTKEIDQPTRWQPCYLEKLILCARI